MGYTHYYSLSPKVKRLPVDGIAVALDQIAERHGNLVTVERLDPCRIVLHDAGPDPYESLFIAPPCLLRGRDRHMIREGGDSSPAPRGWFWNFTKTARRPYDVAICTILARLQIDLGPDLFSFDSDGIGRPYHYAGHVLTHDAGRIAVDGAWPEVFRADLTRDALPILLDRERRRVAEGEPGTMFDTTFRTEAPEGGWNLWPGAEVHDLNPAAAA